MSVEKISVFGIHSSYGLLRLLYRRKAAVKLLHAGSDRIVYPVHLVLFQLLHEPSYLGSVSARKVPEKSLKIAGHQNVHGRGIGQMELSSRIVHSCIYEIREDFVLVGRAYKSAHRHAHKPRVVCGQNVSEVARRNHHVHRLSVLYRSRFHQLDVAVDVVCDLRNQPSYVDGIC